MQELVTTEVCSYLFTRWKFLFVHISSSLRNLLVFVPAEHPFEKALRILRLFLCA